MLRQEQVLAEIGRDGSAGGHAIDGRDYERLCQFFPVEDWATLGFMARKDASPVARLPWTEQEVRAQLAGDVAFGFQKALDKRGISADCMYQAVKMWMWVLEDELQHHGSYAHYGLPLFKAVAVKYGLPNPIGDDFGDEYQYSSEAGY